MKKEWLLVILALLLGVVIARFTLCPTCPTCPDCPPSNIQPPVPGPVIDISGGPADGGYAITVRRDGNVLTSSPEYKLPGYFFYKVPQPRLINSSTQQMWLVSKGFQSSVSGGSLKYVKSGGTNKWTCTDGSGTHDLADGGSGWEKVPNCMLLTQDSAITVMATEGGASYQGDWAHLETELP